MCNIPLPLMIIWLSISCFSTYSIEEKHMIKEQQQLDKFIINSNITCQPCPKGFYIPKDNKTCGASCPTGYCPDIKFCLPCKPGTYNSKLNASSCTSCEVGWVAPAFNQIGCAPCASGETSSQNHVYCIGCTPGFYNPNTGSACKPCSAGTYSNKHKSYNCTKCPAGTYNDQSGQEVCSHCGKGKYNPFNGTKSSNDCKSCPKKYYCPSPRTTKPVKCPSDHFCDSGSAKPSVCPVLYQSGSKATECSPSVWFYVIIACCLLIVLTFGVAIWLVVSRRFFRKKPVITKSMEERSEVEKMIPEPLPGPVYQGF